MKTSCTLLFLILYCLFQNSASAQKILIVTDYTQIAPGDTFQVSFVIDGSGEDYKNFKTGTLNGLKETGGPYQSQSSSMKIVKGKTVTTKSISITYKFTAPNEGTFTVGPAQVEDSKGHILYSDSITVTAKAGYKKAPGIIHGFPNTSDPFADLWDDPVSFQRLNRSALQIRYMRITATGKPYLLIIGWPYLPGGHEHNAKKLLHEAAASLRQQKGVHLTDSLWEDDMPRYYFVLEDTTGIRAPLEAILAKARPGMKSTVILTPVQDWNIFKETNAFDNEHEIWTLIFSLVKDKQFPRLARKYPAGDIEVRLRFGSKAKKEAFTPWAEAKGYHFNTAADTTSDTTTRRYETAGYILSTPLNEAAIYKTISTITNEAAKEEYGATFNGYTLFPLKKKK